MASSLQQWEADPLFSAAEVVQDSADRMDSLFRLLLHDQSLLQEDHSDPRLLATIDYHRRDLVTILETAKWQLEDFERAVNTSAMSDKSQSKEDVVARHRQFITAIREQIKLVEERIEGPSMRKNAWVNLNDQDRDGLALFLDPTSALSLTGDEIVEQEKIEKIQMNGHVYGHHCLVNGDTHKEISSDRDCNIEGKWDLEASEAAPSRNIFHENMLRAVTSRVNLRFLRNFWTIYGNKGSRSHTKRLKDGEDQINSLTPFDDSPYVQGQLGCGFESFQVLISRFQANAVRLSSNLGVRYQVLPSHVQVNRHSVQMVLTMIFALIFLGILVFRIA
ncbi:unnamed protein product [Linum tenue]|uniref:Syntaxin 6/10/61 N-terminal domain-containing protein n=1 Tax=Linum tenue TaxID=586396 RepID=A0AAV0I3Z4_9ROSI|nr:unnamed protein product [Linum tenue]